MSRLEFAVFGSGGITNPKPGSSAKCAFCGEGFRFLEVAIEFLENEVCPTCVLAGPKEMARRIREHSSECTDEWEFKMLQRWAVRLEKKESIADIRGGIFAVKIAEAYREVSNRRKARKGRRDGRQGAIR